MTDQVSTRLGYIQEELGAIVDERIQALEAVLQNAERMTRRLLKAEMELEHLNSNEGDLKRQAETLEQEMETVRARVAQSKDGYDALLSERDQLRTEQENLTAETASLREEVEALRATVEGVEDEANKLRAENTGLRTKAKALQENVTRMRQLRDELMSSISGLTQQMSGLAGGETE